MIDNNHNSDILINKSITCEHCNQVFQFRSSKSKHIKNKVCLKKKPELLELRNKIIELETKLQSSIIVNNNNNTNNTNNGTINNNIIKVSFGKEDIEEISVRDKKSILNRGYTSLLKLIEVMHLNDDYKKFQNVSITNLTNKYGKYYSEKDKCFITKTKKELIDDIIEWRTNDLKNIHEKYNKNTNVHNNVLKLIHKLENYKPDTEDDELYKFYKEYCQDITMLFYNKSKIFKV
jgi:hypothetical protein